MENKKLDEFFEKRLLIKIQPDINKAKRSLEIAKERLKKAEEALNLKFYDFCILESYMAMFHCARALLYKEGIQEKSHFALSFYIKEKHSKEIPINIINLLDIHRIERQETMYGLDYNPDLKDAKSALDDAKKFLKAFKDFLKKDL